MVPKLRFLEFERALSWRDSTLGIVCSNIASGKDKLNSSGSYNLYGSTGIIGKSSIYSYEGSPILVARVGANAGFITRPNGKFGVTDNTLVITLNANQNVDFIYYSLLQFELNRLVFGSGQPLITGGQLKALRLFLPNSAEQQKIADCLSSLDDLIAAETEKLEALQAHKKGLMQKLFPSPLSVGEGSGERLPELRFAGFSGEWEEKSLGEIGKFTGGGTPSKLIDDYWNGNIPWISSSDIAEDSIFHIKTTRFISEDAIQNSATKRVPPNSILLVSRVGVGKLAVTKDSLCTSQDFTNFTPDKDNLVFLGYYLKSQSHLLLQFSQGMAIRGFTKDDVSKLTILIPILKEQQKIADCLSALDEQIATQNERLEALKLHKKGLMQGLFPSHEGA